MAEENTLLKTAIDLFGAGAIVLLYIAFIVVGVNLIQFAANLI